MTRKNTNAVTRTTKTMTIFSMDQASLGVRHLAETVVGHGYVARGWEPTVQGGAVVHFATAAGVELVRFSAAAITQARVDAGEVAS